MSNENCSCPGCQANRAAKGIKQSTTGHANGISSTGTGGNTSAVKLRCAHCGKEVTGGTYIQNVFYCPMCTSIINKNNGTVVPAEPASPFTGIKMPMFYMMPDSCKQCGNHTSNGGSGICHCTIPLMNGHGPTCHIGDILSAVEAISEIMGPIVVVFGDDSE